MSSGSDNAAAPRSAYGGSVCVYRTKTGVIVLQCGADKVFLSSTQALRLAEDLKAMAIWPDLP